LDFWFENIPSGNPGMNFTLVSKKATHEKPDGGREPRVGLHHLRRLLLDDERPVPRMAMTQQFFSTIFFKEDCPVGERTRGQFFATRVCAQR
jgi:hypothetical protein